MTPCPCGALRREGTYLCRSCWFGLRQETRERLRRRDDRARERALQLFRAIRSGTPLKEIEVPA